MYSNKGGPKPRLVREACVQDTRVDKECLLPIGLWTLAHPPWYIRACLSRVRAPTRAPTYAHTWICPYSLHANMYLTAHTNTHVFPIRVPSPDMYRQHTRFRSTILPGPSPLVLLRARKKRSPFSSRTLTHAYARGFEHQMCSLRKSTTLRVLDSTLVINQPPSI